LEGFGKNASRPPSELNILMFNNGRGHRQLVYDLEFRNILILFIIKIIEGLCIE
jgi:hypothetical protein